MPGSNSMPWKYKETSTHRPAAGSAFLCILHKAHSVDGRPSPGRQQYFKRPRELNGHPSAMTELSRQSSILVHVCNDVGGL